MGPRMTFVVAGETSMGTHWTIYIVMFEISLIKKIIKEKKEREGGKDKGGRKKRRMGNYSSVY